MAEFAELCAKTNFSLLEGASRPEEMVEKAHELGLYALAIADRGGLYGSVRAHIAARKLSQRYLVGTELLVCSERAKKSPSAKVVFLVQDRSGYRNLCRLTTLAHADLPREKARLSLSHLAGGCEGLFAILRVARESEIRRGESTLDDDFEIARALRENVGARAFVAVSRLLSPDDDHRERWARRASKECDLPLIASAEPLFHHPSRKPIADVLQCIRDKTTLDRAGDHLSPNAQAYLRSAQEMTRLFRDAPERVARTVEIANACTFSLGDLEYSFPSDDALPGETPDGALCRLVGEWAPRRYPNGVPSGVAAQLEKELFLIARLKVAQFFLSVYEIVKIAREKRILCQGRGSAANSAVCFVLGITAVDPARSNLLFERFLSCERGEPPDIDVDFEHERREEVIQAIYQKYGRERAAMVSEVTCYRGKSALRESAKAFGFSLEQADRLTHMVGPYDPVDAHPERLRELGFCPGDGRVKLVLRVASELQGFPRHMSTHVGGFVLSARPLDEVCPIEPAKMAGRTVVPWDKDDIDALGFFKVDVLGLGMLTAIRKGLELVQRSSPARPPAGGGASSVEFDPIGSLADVPPEDPAVYDAICRADTIGVFQIESRAQMAMLPRMKPRRFYDLVIEVAIVRPGPIQGGMVHPYLRRRSGEEEATMPHPSLEPILNRTLGVPLFQEQVMQIAIVGGGYTAGQADELRRDMAAWRRTAKLLRHQDKLVKGFVDRGISRDFADRLFSQIKGFGEYGFPESHAASFALLVYASAWIKVHHPLEFACALLNSQPMGFYSVSSIVRDAQAHGVDVLSPDVEQSHWDCTVEGRANRKPAMRLGLRIVKGMGEDVANRIVEAREEMSFRDVKDLVFRAGLRSDQADALAEAGALDSLSNGRRQAMWKVRAPADGQLFERAESNEPAVELPRLAKVDQLRFDYARLGLSVSDHPMRHLRAQMNRRGVITSRHLFSTAHGTKVEVAGLVLSRQRPMTASGVVFVTLEDETGMTNLILTPDIFDRSYRVAVHARLLLARGKVERTPRNPHHGDHPVIHVLVEAIEPLELPGGLEARSRDFR